MAKPASSSRLKKRLLSLGVGVALALLAGEIVVRLVPATVLGFSFEDGGYTTPKEFDRDKTENELGLHDVPVPERVEGVQRILLVGDSYVAAESVSVDRTVGQRLQHHLQRISGQPYQVISAGRSGDGQREELERLRELGPELQPDLVLCLFLTLNDIRNNSPALHDRAREQARSQDRVRPRWIRIPADEAMFLFAEWSALNRLVSYVATRRFGNRDAPQMPLDYAVYEAEWSAEIEQAWTETQSLLLEMREVSRDLGARFGLVSASTPQGSRGDIGLAEMLATYPDMRAKEWDLDGPDRRLAAFADEQEIPLTLLEPVVRERQRDGSEVLHWRYDGHWNVQGNDVAGEEIAKFVLEAFPPAD